MNRLKTLIHVHTDYSFDSDISVPCLAEFAVREGIGCVAVTDHDSIDGARHLCEIADIKVIIGEEVTTRDGDLIGLFLQEWIRPGMSARATAEAIREQGGLVLLPHPFVSVFGHGLGRTSWGIADWIDAVEVHNAQNVLRRPDRRAAEFARERGLPVYVGADSHSRHSIAPCFQIMPDFDGTQGFLTALQAAEFVSGRHNPSYFVGAGLRIARAALGLPLPAGFGANHSPYESADYSLPRLSVVCAA
jgi:hypothetical protein